MSRMGKHDHRASLNGRASVRNRSKSDFNIIAPALTKPQMKGPCLIIHS